MTSGFVSSLYNQQTEAMRLYGTTDPSAAPDDPSTDLTPDALLIYCQSRLGSIDGQIGTLISSQKASAANTSALNKALALLQKDSAGTTSRDDCSQMESSLHDAITSIESTDPNCPALPDLIKAYNNLVYTGTGPTATNPYYPQGATPTDPKGDPGDGKINQSEMTSFIDTVQGAVSDMNSNAEMQMISIQSLVSQRQTAVQLTTNLVQALGDQQNKIADNIGH